MSYSTREWRLRLRIDRLIDERDHARAQLEECRRLRHRQNVRIQNLERSLTVWKNRAYAWRNGT